MMHFINVNAITRREKNNKNMNYIDKYRKEEHRSLKDATPTSVVIK
jgi:hypothetical protein